MNFKRSVKRLEKENDLIYVLATLLYIYIL
jgi:hypothetical protein